MSALALTFVLIAAFTHATWNFAAKRSGGGLPFVWLTGLLSFGFYIPAIIGYCLWFKPELPDVSLLLFVVSGTIKTCYALFLQRGYRTGDFSLIYPLARGTGPLLSTLAAIAFLGERPSLVALAGALVIIGAIFFLTGGPRLFHESSAHLRNAISY